MKKEYSDILTGLPNLILFHKMIDDLITHSPELDRFAIVCLSIENLREIKEAFGYKTGEKAIKGIADYLDNAYFTSRIAEGRFALLIPDIKSKKYLENIMEELMDKVRTAYSCDKEQLYISMIAGISIYPVHGSDTAVLLQNAEAALNLAKENGEDIQIYKDAFQEDVMTQVHMANMLQNGLDRQEFTLSYQPEFDLRTLEIIGVEALVRWYQPENGFISPEDFIPIAEKSRLIYKLEQWIVNKALSQKLQWEKEGLHHLELSINMSSKTLESERYFDKMENIISSYNVDYSKVIIELTETMNLANLDCVADRLKRLKKLGIKIALDDFGTGFSSLNHLRTLPIDIIKIDKSFIQSVLDNNKEAIIVKNMIAMSHELDYRVVAEGIETQEQYDFLIQNCGERGQGFLLCMPIPEEKLSELMKICKYNKEIAV